jgi:hypothetical protein
VLKTPKNTSTFFMPQQGPTTKANLPATHLIQVLQVMREPADEPAQGVKRGQAHALQAQKQKSSGLVKMQTVSLSVSWHNQSGPFFHLQVQMLLLKRRAQLVLCAGNTYFLIRFCSTLVAPPLLEEEGYCLCILHPPALQH